MSETCVVSRREPEASCDVPLSLVERQEGEATRVGIDEEGIGDMPQISPLEVTEPHYSIELRGQGSIRVDPRQPRQQMRGVALDALSFQRGAQLGLEQIRGEQAVETAKPRCCS